MADIVTIIPANPLVFVVGYENLKAMLEDGLIANTKNLSNIFFILGLMRLEINILTI